MTKKEFETQFITLITPGVLNLRQLSQYEITKLIFDKLFLNNKLCKVVSNLFYNGDNLRIAHVANMLYKKYKKQIYRAVNEHKQQKLIWEVS